jgi:hypothetical protein
MATMTITITTPSQRKPASRADDVAERQGLQQVLLQIVSAISNCASYSGQITGGPVSARYSYQAGTEEKAA